jgi:pilus assembly protein CpaE
MKTSADKAASRVLALTEDAAFATAARDALSEAGLHFRGTANVAQALAAAANGDADVILVDVDRAENVEALARHPGGADGKTAIIAVQSQFDAEVARRLILLRVSDFLLKPVAAEDLVRACRGAARTPAAAPRKEAKICAFLPASGGVGVTTLAIETALLHTKNAREAGSTCLVDLDFQHGACADYLDLEPRLDLDEIEPRPERLDSQLLEVLLSHHASGLAVIAAPNRPAEMRSFDPQVVMRLLDLVSVRFEHVVLDLPRTWFAWTDNVLLGSDDAFIVTEATVPGVRHARALVEAIRNRLGDKASPRVIVNRFEQRMFASGVKRNDIRQALGDMFAGAIPNDYQLVREAIDRGVPLSEVKPRNEVSAELRRVVMPPVKESRSPLAAMGARIGLFQTT